MPTRRSRSRPTRSCLPTRSAPPSGRPPPLTAKPERQHARGATGLPVPECYTAGVLHGRPAQAITTGAEVTAGENPREVRGLSRTSRKSRLSLRGRVSSGWWRYADCRSIVGPTKGTRICMGIDDEPCLIGGVEKRGIIIADYDPAWPQQYERPARLIRDVLGSRLMRIEHIRSTALPGLPANP